MYQRSKAQGEQVLQAAGLDVTVVIDAIGSRSERNRQAAVARLARRGLPAGPILCADTTVARGRTIYGKPQDDRDAARMLKELSGATHRVLTAVAVCNGRKRRAALSDSRVSFAPWGAVQIAAYVASGEPRGKAGAYAIQGPAAGHIARIAGSYSGIMGLPLFETAQLLKAVGAGALLAA